MKQETQNRRFLQSFLISVTVFNALWCGLAHFQVGAKTPLSAWQRKLLDAKKEDAARMTGPKVIFVSASSSLFGLRSRLIEKEFKVPVLNLGLAGNFGLEGILHYAEQFAKEKDTVILAFEADFFTEEFYKEFNIETLDFLSSIAPDYFRTLSIKQRVKAYYTLPTWRLWMGVKAKLGIPIQIEQKPGRWTYPLDAINEKGEVTCNDSLSEEKKEFKEAFLKFSAPEIHFRHSDKSTPFERLKEFIALCKKRGVRVLAAYAPRIDRPEYKSRPVLLADQIRAFYESQGVPVLNRFQDELYPAALLYDDENHLTDEGARQRTGRLVSALKPYF